MEFKKASKKDIHRNLEVAHQQGAVDASPADHDPVEQFNTRVPYSVQRRFARFCADRDIKKGETVAEALTIFMNMKGFEQ